MAIAPGRPDPAFWSGKRVLLTGHTGFKGSWAAMWLSRMGAEVTGLALAAVSPWLGALFSPDPDVRRALVPVLLVAAVFQPAAGVVFVLDGVLIGAGDGRYLAAAGLVVLGGYAPLVLLTGATSAALPLIWLVFGALFIGGRLVTLVRRARTDDWLVLGTAS